MSAVPADPVRPSMSWPLWSTVAVCGGVVLFTGLSVWLRIDVLRVFFGQGFPSAVALASLMVPGVMGLAAWWVLVRLLFRRSVQLALRFVAAVFLASLLVLALEFEAADLDFVLQLIWLAALAMLFRALLRRVRDRAVTAS